LRAVTVFKNVLNDLVQVTFEHYKSIHVQDEYETACGKERLELEWRYRSVVAERLRKYDVRCVVERERTL
jgi:hypothetical protein